MIDCDCESRPGRWEGCRNDANRQHQGSLVCKNRNTPCGVQEDGVMLVGARTLIQDTFPREQAMSREWDAGRRINK